MNQAPFFTKLLSPARIGGFELKNRIVMPPMGTNMAIGGLVNQAIIDHYEARARGGAGLIIVEVTCVDTPAGQNLSNMLVLDDDRYIPGMAQLVAAIHHHGAKAVIQLSHTGRGARQKITGQQPVGPSSVPMPFSPYTGLAGETPRELTTMEIKDIELKFAAAAKRAQTAGFDGVMIHGGGYYLVAQFISRTANVRKDQYGGKLKNRARFPLEIIAAIRNITGPDFPIFYKMNGLEIGKGGGVRMIDGLRLAKLLQTAGVKAIELIAMAWGLNHKMTPSSGEANGLMVPLLRIFKKFLKVPLIAEGRINPVLGERLLCHSRADLIAIGRSLIANPDLPRIISTGQTNDLKPCIGCARCIANQLMHDRTVICSLNPEVGYLARELELKPAGILKKVLVVGGGPAGMEAAIIAARRGHQVTLFEKNLKLGGQLNRAVIPPHKCNLLPLASYLQTQMDKSGVAYQCGIEVTPELIAAEHPDAVIIAGGAYPCIPSIPGSDSPTVFPAVNVLDGQKTGSKVVIIGGGLIGCETAEVLQNRGKQVTIVEMLPELAGKMVVTHQVLLLERLRHSGVQTYTGTQCLAIKPGQVIIKDREGQIHSLKADNVLIAVGDKPDRMLQRQIEGMVPECYTVGDYENPGDIASAIAGGYRIALRI